jgi:hypothetical protein
MGPMPQWRNRRLIILIALATLPIEALAMHLMTYAAHVGSPKNPTSSLRLVGDLLVLFHTPPVLLNEFACRRIRVPGYILYADTFVFGYALSVLILWWIVRSRNSSSSR